MYFSMLYFRDCLFYSVRHCFWFLIFLIKPLLKQKAVILLNPFGYLFYTRLQLMGSNLQLRKSYLIVTHKLFLDSGYTG